MASITIIQSSVETTLHTENGAALLLDADGATRAEVWLVGGTGTGMAPMHMLSEKGPQQHGATYRGFRLDVRHIAYVFELSCTTLADVDDGRDALYALFTPTDTPLLLRLNRDNGSVRQAECFFVGGFDGDTKEIEGGLWQKIAITLECFDPLWYDPANIALAFGAAGAAVGMAVPWLIPWRLGASSISQSRTVIYPGTFETHPIVRIVGPITSPVVRNLTSPFVDKLDFTGTTITAGAYYAIDTVVKTVLDQNGTNQISKLTSDSDLSTFALLPHPIAPGGVNTLTVGGTGVTSATSIYISYYVRYVGA